MTISREVKGSGAGNAARRRLGRRPGRRLGTIAGITLVLAASGAHAGSKVIFTGPVSVGAGQTFGCRALNVSADKTLTGVTVIVRRSNGTLASSSTCPALEPLNVCGTSASSTPGPGVVSCEATSDKGAKLLRATLSNDATGNSSDAR